MQKIDQPKNISTNTKPMTGSGGCGCGSGKTNLNFRATATMSFIRETPKKNIKSPKFL